MAFQLQQIQDTLAQRIPQGDAWHDVRQCAMQRLEKVGMPRPRSDAFYFVPQSLIAAIRLPAPHKDFETQYPEALTQGWIKALANESDLAALLPVLLCSAPRIHTLKPSADWQEIVIASEDPYALELVQVPAKSKVRIVWNNSFTQGFSSQRLDLHAEEGCQVELTVTKGESQSFQHSRIRLDANASVQWLEADMGSSLHRTGIEAHLQGESASFAFRALSLLHADQHSHRRLKVIHAAPGVHSEQFVRHILQGKSQASCDTQVEINKGITGTEAHQLVNSLLLSNEAKASAKPTLIINNDDVKASHGTTCGDLDQTQLFYMKSRGLSDGQARQLLLNAFAESLLGAHPESSQRAALVNLVRETLSARFQ